MPPNYERAKIVTKKSYLCSVEEPTKFITPIDSGLRFPEVLDALLVKYEDDIALFTRLIHEAKSSEDLLRRIRSSAFSGAQRMSLLKMFRRCVSTVLDTEATKKIKTITTESLIEAYGSTFKPINKLKEQFAKMTSQTKGALAALVGEYDTRGQSGYQLTGMFFEWFEKQFAGKLTITGPRGAGRDVELSTIFADYSGGYPCDFVIHDMKSKPLAVGFARYDATRGGAQSDDRTGGNANKVDKARRYSERTGKKFRLLFLADGPGLVHGDTWEEACNLDEDWNDNVRVTTLKLAPKRVTLDWLTGA